SLFPDSAIGAMPPFGNLYGLQTYVDMHLAEQDYIVFEAGTHTDAIKMSYRDYEKIVKPKLGDLAIKLHPMKGAWDCPYYCADSEGSSEGFVGQRISLSGLHCRTGNVRGRKSRMYQRRRRDRACDS